MAQRALAEAAGIDRGTIAKLESEGDSRVTELPKLGLILKLAVALEVPPVALLYPDLPDGKVEVWPRVVVPSITALQWFSGEKYPEEVVAISEVRKPDKRTVNEQAESYIRIRNSRERAELLDQIQELERLASRRGDEKAAAVRRAIHELKSEVGNLEMVMRLDGWPVVDDA